MKKTISIRMVHVLAVILFAGATLVDSELCPPADNIFPCVCHGDLYIKDVECENMTTVDYFRSRLGGRLFMEPIPKLLITNLQSSMLPSHALGDIEVVDLSIIIGNIPHISEPAFRGQPLQSLGLESIRLEAVPTAALDSLKDKLETLSMYDNLLKKLEHSSLTGLFKLQKLRLSGNQISEIATISLPANLQSLGISANKLTTFNNSLHHTKHLKALYASHNNFTSIKRELDGLFGLQTLYLDFNHISNISGCFSDVPSLEVLNLAHNEIREIGEALADLRNLRSLSLANNGITNLNPKVFENMKVLDELNIGDNLLTAFQICPSLITLRSLRKLRIINSTLKSLPSDCFDNNRNLQRLYLSYNQLSALNLTYATNLYNLDIMFNNFRSLNNLVLPEAGSASLYLDDNQWLCSRETTSLLKGLVKRGYIFRFGYPACLPISEKPQTCLNYRYINI